MFGIGFLIGATLAAALPASMPQVYVTDATLWRGQTGSGLWRPTGVQVADAKEALRTYLRDSKVTDRSDWERARRQEISSKFDSYVLQMQGVRQASDNKFFDTDGNGPKQIHVDGFCPEIARGMGETIKHQQVRSSDGGSCIFQAMYDLRSKRIALFLVNGVA